MNSIAESGRSLKTAEAVEVPERVEVSEPLDPVRVLVFRRNRLLYDALSVSLRRELQLEVVGAVADQHSLLERLHDQAVDVLIIDSDDQEHVTIGMMHRVVALEGNRRIVVLCAGSDEETMVRFIEAGAIACISRSSSLRRLVEAIRLVNEGKSPCSPRVTGLICRRLHHLARELRLRQVHPGSELTPRESQILDLLAQGLVNKEIAHEAGIRVQTVKSHVYNIFKKLDVNSRGDAVIKGIEFGLIGYPALADGDSVDSG